MVRKDRGAIGLRFSARHPLILRRAKGPSRRIEGRNRQTPGAPRVAETIARAFIIFVMPGLDPGIHAVSGSTSGGGTEWIAGSSPAMTMKRKTEMAMTETDGTGRAKETEALRWASNFLCQWRVCANASCRRARVCRGRAHLCGKRNGPRLAGRRARLLRSLPRREARRPPLRGLPGRHGGTRGDQAFFAWRKAANASPRRAS